MSASQLVNNERAIDTIVYVADYKHIAANATSANQVTIGKIPAGGAVRSVFVYEQTPLAGASDITLDVGTSGGDPDEFIDALDVDAMTAPVYNTGDAFPVTYTDSNSDTVSVPQVIAGATNTATDILVEWNGTVASLTAGQVVVVVEVFNPGKFV